MKFAWDILKKCSGKFFGKIAYLFVNNSIMKKKVVRLTEEDLVRIVKKVIREQSEQNLDGAKITKLSINQNRVGSYVTLSNGETYKYSEGSNLELPSMGYTQQCKPGEYSGNNLPEYCTVSIKLEDKSRYKCDGKRCKKIENDKMMQNNKMLQ